MKYNILSKRNLKACKRIHNKLKIKTMKIWRKKKKKMEIKQWKTVRQFWLVRHQTKDGGGWQELGGRGWWTIIVTWRYILLRGSTTTYRISRVSDETDRETHINEIHEIQIECWERHKRRDQSSEESRMRDISKRIIL